HSFPTRRSSDLALAEEVEETAELFRGAHDDNSFRRNRRVASSPPTIAYAAKTRREVAGSGTNPSPPPPGPGRTVAPPSTLVMMPEADDAMNQGSTLASERIPLMIAKMSVKRDRKSVV